MNSFPRRIVLEQMEPAELAIYHAIQEIEKIGADPRLTEAVVLLSEAKDLVSDFIDGKPAEDTNKIPDALLDYLSKVFNEVKLVEGAVKRVSQYGSSAFVVLESGKTYRLNFQSYNSNVSLD